MSKRIEDMAPAAQPKARAFIAELTARNIPHAIIETRRTQVVQLAYWLQGRAEYDTINAVRGLVGLRHIGKEEAGRIITKADGVLNRSSHQTGMALDVAPVLPATGAVLWNYVKYAKQYRAISEVAQRHGFVCGVDFPPIDPVSGLGWDPPHYQVG